MTDCVCGKPASDHLMGFGTCRDFDHCHCRHYEPDDGSRPLESAVIPEAKQFPYTGRYSRHYELNEESA